MLEALNQELLIVLSILSTLVSFYTISRKLQDRMREDIEFKVRLEQDMKHSNKQLESIGDKVDALDGRLQVVERRFIENA